MPSSKVHKVMSSEVCSFELGTPVVEVAVAMTEQAISCVVVCEGERPVGVISERDVSGVLRTVLEGGRVPAMASDIMSSPPITIIGEALVSEAMETVERCRIRRLVVVDAHGNLAGLITQSDLLRAHAIEIEEHQHSLEDAIAARTSELAEANRRLEALSLKDSLLGIGNRRAMELELAKQTNLADRYGRIYSVALLDVDHFKAYNDSYGHPEADTVLQQIAAALSTVTRGSDSLYRYGGEEILMLLPETKLAGARQAGERARCGIESLSIPHRGSPLGIVTVSVGVAELQPSGDSSEHEWLATIQHADEGLYLAKSEGRNRTCAVTAASDPVDAVC